MFLAIRFGLALVVLSALTLLALAATSSTLRGRITDASGASIVGAEVTVTNTATNLARKVVTNANGLYLVREVPPHAGSDAFCNNSTPTRVDLRFADWFARRFLWSRRSGCRPCYGHKTPCG